MNIQGLDYNTKRERLVLPEYGREIQKMVDHAVQLPTKEERQQCAATIVGIMERMSPQNRENPEYKQKLWDHLALMSNFQLDIDWPFDVTSAQQINSKPEPLGYPMTQIPVRHYGKLIFEVLEKLKTMPPSPERDELARITANQMKQSLLQWSHGSCDDEKVVADMARFTDGNIQLDLNTFRFEKISEKELRRRKK
ncbi:MAG: DUF4290 domain-containing protein [Prevotella sp.]|nr:DUF4290 domain-containing protein [Prevotella sp.]